MGSLEGIVKIEYVECPEWNEFAWRQAMHFLYSMVEQITRRKNERAGFRSGTDKVEKAIQPRAARTANGRGKSGLRHAGRLVYRPKQDRAQHGLDDGNPQ